MANYSEAFLKETISVWQPRYRESLTLNDAREIAANMAAFARLLISLDRKYGQELAASTISNKEGQSL
jgi:hypothetical protein